MNVRLFLLFCLALVATAASGQVIQTSGVGSGLWSDPASWTPNTVPNSTNSASIVINNGHTIAVNGNYTVDQLTINGTLNVNAGQTLTISNGTGNDLTMGGSGLFNVSGTVLGNNGFTTVGNTAANTSFLSGSIYRHLYATTEGSIPLATWNVNSRLEITGYTGNITATAAGNWSQNFGNVIFACGLANAVVNFKGLLNNISGSFDIGRTGNSSSLIVLTDASSSISVGQDFIIRSSSRALVSSVGTISLTVGRDFIFTSTSASGSVLNTSSNITLNVHGNFNLDASGGFLYLNKSSSTGSSIINLTGQFNLISGSLYELGTSAAFSQLNFVSGGAQTFTNTGSIVGKINYFIPVGTTVDLGTSPMPGTGTFTLTGTAILRSLNATGAIANGSGNIQIPTAKSFYNSGSRVIFAGSAPQFIGAGHPTSLNVTTEIANASHVSLAANSTIGGPLNLNGGNLIVNANTLTLQSPVTTSSNFIQVGATSNLTISGTGAFGTLPLSSNATVNNFILNRTSSIVSLNTDLTIGGTLNLQNGDLDFSNTVLLINNAYTRTNGRFFGNASATFRIGGSGALTTPLVFNPTGNTIGTFILNRASATITTSSAFTVTTLFNLNRGVFSNASSLLTLSNGATLLRNSLASFTGAAPAGGPYNLTYSGTSLTNGAESSGALATVTNTTTGTVTVSSPLTVGTSLVLSSGVWSNASGTTSMSNGSSLVRNGTATFTGLAPSGGPYNLVFNGSSYSTGVEALGSLNQVTSNLTGVLTLSNPVSATGTLTIASGTLNSGSNAVAVGAIANAASFIAPSSTLTLSGNFVNNNSFSHNGGTVIFNGTSAISGVTTSFNAIQLNASRSLTFPAQINIAGNVSFASGSTFAHSSGIVTLNDGANQNIDVNGAQFYAVTVNKSGNGITLLSALNLANVLAINSATNVASNGFLTVLSQPNGPGDDTGNDGSIGPIFSGGSVTGNVTVQRFILAKGLGNRYISSTVVGAGLSQLTDDFPVSVGTIRYYREVTAGAIGVGYQNWSINSTLQQGTGYVARMPNSNVMLDLTGNIFSGTVTLPTTYTSNGNANADGWNLVGNPYASPIIWNNDNSAWDRTNIDPIISVYDFNGSSIYTYNYLNGSGNLPNGMIATGQAFWVHLSAAGSLAVKENAKVSAVGGKFYRTSQKAPDQLIVSLTDNQFRDNSFLVLDENATENFDPLYDGQKAPTENFSIYFPDKEGRTLGMMAMNEFSDSQKIPMEVNVTEPGQYFINFSGQQFSKLAEAYFIDEQENVSVPLSEVKDYPFTVSKDNQTLSNRFYLSLNGGEGATVKESNRVVAYPNPVVDFLTINAGTETASVKLFDPTGRLIFSGNSKDQSQIDMRDYPNGIYVLKINSGGGLIAKRIVKK